MESKRSRVDGKTWGEPNVLAYSKNLFKAGQKLEITKSKKTGSVYIDPLGEKLADGTIRAPKLTASDAFKRFG